MSFFRRPDIENISATHVIKQEAIVEVVLSKPKHFKIFLPRKELNLPFIIRKM